MSESMDNVAHWYQLLNNPPKLAKSCVVSTNLSGLDRDASSKTNVSKSQKTKPDNDELAVKKAWEQAIAPAKQIPMNFIMSYMSGNSLQLIPIIMTLTVFWNPLKQLMKPKQPFARFYKSKAGLKSKKSTAARDIDAFNGQIDTAVYAFILFNICNMLVGVWKLNRMGLLPNTQSDWLAWENPIEIQEIFAKH